MAGMLTAAEIASLRATQATAWPDVGVIHRPTLTPDGMGGMTTGTANVGTVYGRLMPINSSAATESLGAGQPLSVGNYWWTVPHDTNIRADDTVTVNGQLLYVKEVNLEVEWATAKRCRLDAHNQGVL